MKIALWNFGSWCLCGKKSQLTLSNVVSQFILQLSGATFNTQTYL